MLTIRRYIPSDQPAVEHLHVIAIQAVGAYPGRGRWDDDIYAIPAHYLNKHGEFLVGEIDGRLVAMGAFRHISSTYAEITRMRVHPDFQRQGFGTLILQELEARARAQGYTILHLHTTTVQIAAQKLYENHGFHEVEREMYHQFQVILYEKNLLQ